MAHLRGVLARKQGRFAGVPKKPRADRSEHDEQRDVVGWFRVQHRDITWCLVASANGLALGGTPAQKAAHWAKFLAAGGCPGHADLHLMVMRGGYGGLFIEMKKERATKADVTDDQLAFIGMAIQQGYAATWCAGFHEAVSVINEYLQGECSWMGK